LWVSGRGSLSTILATSSCEKKNAQRRLLQAAWGPLALLGETTQAHVFRDTLSAGLPRRGGVPEAEGEWASGHVGTWFQQQTVLFLKVLRSCQPVGPKLKVPPRMASTAPPCTPHPEPTTSEQYFSQPTEACADAQDLGPLQELEWARQCLNVDRHCSLNCNAPRPSSASRRFLKRIQAMPRCVRQAGLLSVISDHRRKGAAEGAQVSIGGAVGAFHVFPQALEIHPHALHFFRPVWQGEVACASLGVRALPADAASPGRNRSHMCIGLLQ
jgi:hypothetical protein